MSGGGFSSVLITAGDTCTPDPDTTSYALQALSLVPGCRQRGEAAVATCSVPSRPMADTSARQAKTPTRPALAGQALLGVPERERHRPAGGTPGAVATGQAFLLPLQNPDGGFGIRASSPASDVRSSTQAVPALVGATLVTLSDAGGAGRRRRPSSRPSSTQPAATGPPYQQQPRLSHAPASHRRLASTGATASSHCSVRWPPPLRPPGGPVLGLTAVLAGAALLPLTRADPAALMRRLPPALGATVCSPGRRRPARRRRRRRPPRCRWASAPPAPG